MAFIYRRKLKRPRQTTRQLLGQTRPVRRRRFKSKPKKCSTFHRSKIRRRKEEQLRNAMKHGLSNLVITADSGRKIKRVPPFACWPYANIIDPPDLCEEMNVQEIAVSYWKSTSVTAL